MDSISYTPAGPVIQAFHKSNAFVRIVEGPVGSSKSSACCIEVFTRACEQKAYQGVRRTRWAVVRNTYPELKSTTIKTWMEWFPFCEMRFDAPITGWVRLPLPDGTRVEAEVMFFPLDRPEEVGKLRSLELTGAWINEASEVAKAVFDMLTQRVDRFPKVSQGGASWSGIILDSNFPDDDHWVYRIFEKQKPGNWNAFKQPGALVFKGGNHNERENYETNPLAENIENLKSGYEYYYRQLPGKSKDWIKVFILAQYGSITDGRPVYPEWNDDIHCKKASPYPGLPLLLGFDYGLTPACAICQVSPRGQLLVLDELFAKDMGIRQFARDIVRPHLALNFHGFGFQAAGDPAGMARKDTDEKTCFMELAEEGIACVPASTNSFVGRREAVAKYLTRMADGQPSLIVDPGCDMIRRGFNGRYQYKRIQLAGEDRYRDIPDKNDFSHCFPGHILIDTPTGKQAIGRLKEGDLVSTPLGPRRITATMNRETKEFANVTFSGGEVWSTPDHPFITPSGVVFADSLQYNDVLIGINTKEARKWADQQSTRSSTSTASSITRSARATTRPISGPTGALTTCTGMCGSFITALFLKALKCITWITIRATTFSLIWSWSRAERTLLIMEGNGLLRIHPWPRPTCIYSARWLPSGTDQKKGALGTQSTASALGKAENHNSLNASGVGSHTKSWWARARKAIALLHVKAQRGELLAWTMSKENALSVLRFLRLTDTPKLEPAPRVAGVSLWETRNPVKVYDLTVEEAHCFFANGVLVHNCHDALQYAALHSLNMNLSEEWTKPIKYSNAGIV